ncbi:MAG: alpha-amylase/4-alpha-glucanotransferase domain-containing protein [Terriglobales bacterium]
MVSLALVLHAHQPVDNFDAVIEEAYARAYRPFLDAIEPRSWLRLTLHFSGWLLDWLAARHPEYVARLRTLRAADRVEMLGGGYFEPILAAIPDADKQEQLERLRNCVVHHTGAAPRGIWLTERVWEPDLPAPLADAGAEFALVDDSHLLMAGLQAAQTYGSYLTEHRGRVLRLVACNHFLRLALPFRPEQEGLGFLAQIAAEHTPPAPSPLLAMGDDLEKFGAWPHTYDHVYRDGWLQRFLDGLEGLAGRVETTTVSAYLDRHPPLGLVYLPTASYPEMMQWALPLPAADDFGRARADAAVAPYRRFLAGAPWRSFLAKYPEANAMHKFALELSRRWEHAAHSAAGDATAQAALEAARTHLLAAECNDAYWHGLFGGLYAPNLRNSVHTHLLAADRLTAQVSPPPPLRRGDFQCNGHDMVELRSEMLRAVIAVTDGGSLAELDYRPADANLTNALRRRPEAYHAALRNRLTGNPAGLPSGREGPGEDMTGWLQYDRYACHGARVYWFPEGKGFEDYLQLTLEEDGRVAGGRWCVAAQVVEAPGVLLRTESGDWEKWLGCEPQAPDTLACRLQRFCGPEAERRQLGIEMVFNLLAPAAPDRAWIIAGQRRALDWSGVAEGGELALEDGWRRCRIELQAAGARTWWLRPIWTVSQSEGGAERVYQGSAALAVWGPAEAASCVTVQTRVRRLD